MGRMSREKGKRGEREVFGLLSDLLGFVVKRNINARKGDCDGLELPGWACEVKRVEAWTEAYWSQAVEQAGRVQRRPVLFYRGSRRPWVAMVDLADVVIYVPRGRHRVEMTLEAFADVARELMNPPLPSTIGTAIPGTGTLIASFSPPLEGCVTTVGIPPEGVTLRTA